MYSNLNKDTLIRLTDGELEICDYVAKRRYKSNRSTGTYDPASHLKEEHSLDMLGAAAELAFIKQAGVYPKDFFSFYVRSNLTGTDTGDVTLAGKVIDVKTTTHKKGRLIVRSSKKMCDIFSFIVQLSDTEYLLKGHFPADDLLVKERFGHHKVFRQPCHMAEQKELLNFDEALKKTC
jgi:hypothetical protein|tara:strand:+ start:1108 stop:1641 length:534 start_codon:yes stop_codon:yes gene_type:complete